MKIVSTNSMLDGGTIAIHTDTDDVFYIDGRLFSKTKGSVYDNYPSAGKIVSDATFWELVKAVKAYEDIEIKREILTKLGTT